jgi:hypothetical protein
VAAASAAAGAAGPTWCADKLGRLASVVSRSSGLASFLKIKLKIEKILKKIPK